MIQTIFYWLGDQWARLFPRWRQIEHDDERGKTVSVLIKADTFSKAVISRQCPRVGEVRFGNSVCVRLDGSQSIYRSGYWFIRADYMTPVASEPIA